MQISTIIALIAETIRLGALSLKLILKKMVRRQIDIEAISLGPAQCVIILSTEP